MCSASNEVLDFRKDALADENLPIASLAAEPRRLVDHRTDRGLVVALFKTNAAEGGIAE